MSRTVSNFTQLPQEHRDALSDALIDPAPFTPDECEGFLDSLFGDDDDESIQDA